MQRNQWLLLFAAVLFLSSCATTIHDIEAVSAVADIPNVAALAQYSNSDNHRRMNNWEFLDFLYAQPERPDLMHPGQILPAKGPAVCLSAEHWQQNETSIAQLCAKGKCNYEQKKMLERAQSFRKKVIWGNRNVNNLFEAEYGGE